MAVDGAVIVFALSTVFLFYVLFGYPLLLRILPWQERGPARKEPAEWKSVSVILPVRNGERWLRAKLQSIFAMDYPQELLEVIVISDGSTDGSEAVAEEFGEKIELLRIPPSGKAAALNQGIAKARGEVLFFTDVRQALDPQALKILVACFEDPSVGVASGELIIRKGESTEEENVGLYWHYEKWIRKQHSRIDSVIGATGAIYSMRRNLACTLPVHTLLDDVHLPLNAFFQGYRVLFVEQAKAYDYPTALETEFHRKVRTLAGVYQVIGAFPALLGPRNRMWIHFMSHKLGRLLLPYALIALFVSGFLLPRPWSLAAVGVQTLFYGLAIADRWISEGGRLKKLSSMVRTFVVLMWAAFCAGSILFLPSGAFWKPPAQRARPAG
ncbi:MAG: glycosyltransferase family 2 protein [Bryobacteraceae bacterium]